MTNVDLAEAVGLSPSPCLMRTRRLEAEGYITGYGARIDLVKLGECVLVFTEVTLGDHRREDFARFEAAVRDRDEIVECHLVSGGYDYLLKIVCRSIGAYQTLMESVLDSGLNIEKYFSYIVIRPVVVKGQYPLARLFDAPD